MNGGAELSKWLAAAFAEFLNSADDSEGVNLPQPGFAHTLDRAKDDKLADRESLDKRKNDDPLIASLFSPVQPYSQGPGLLFLSIPASARQASRDTNAPATAEAALPGDKQAVLNGSIEQPPVAFTGTLKVSGPSPEPHVQISGSAANSEQGTKKTTQAVTDVSQGADLPRREQNFTDKNTQDRGDTSEKSAPGIVAANRTAAPKENPARLHPIEPGLAGASNPMSDGGSRAGYQEHSSSETRSPERMTATLAPTEAPESPRFGSPSTIRLQFPVAHEGGEQGHVDIRVSQRASAVQVSVGTGNSDLAQSLRRHLPELTEQLAQNGIESTFAGKQVSSAEDPAPGGDHNNNGSTRDQDTPRQNQHSRDAQSQTPDRRGRQGQSRWLEEVIGADKGK